MEIVKTVSEIRDIVKEWRKAGHSIGLVPTMGYLHAGHGSLIEQSVKNNDKTVVSIFVNPAQFGPNEDLEKYPRDIKRDSELTASLNGDIIFNPEPEEMYKKNNATIIKVEGLSQKLCGVTRPIHFAGVCQVVSKLFNIVTPDNAYFGLKDFQQYVIINKMVEDLNFPVKINPCAIVREESGLALSSRNVYLTDEEKKSALSLNQSLKYAQSLISNGEKRAFFIINEITKIINNVPYSKIDYVKIVDIDTLNDIDTVEKKYAVLLAVYIGKTRLIDNFTKLL
ncbi:MAG: pantoate--beta-alanine ligase [Mucispirillum sp.]|nr:pantoate--beta-alanine ligase [Mucispirillum sp.]